MSKNEGFAASDWFATCLKHLIEVEAGLDPHHNPILGLLRHLRIRRISVQAGAFTTNTPTLSINTPI